MLFSFERVAYPVFGMDAAAMIPYLIELISQAIKQYGELKQISDTTSDYKNIIERYHAGLDDALRLLSGLPVQDESLLGQIRNFREAMWKIEDVYGAIPKSPETQMLKLHDNSVAESMKIVEDLKEYANHQEGNADRALDFARDASPKGAARATVETNAAILHTLNQLLRVNGQLLKIQSEGLALSNKGDKDSVLHYQRFHHDMGRSLNGFPGDFATPHFE